MSTTTDTATRATSLSGNWTAGVLGGAVGALAMGALIVVMNEATLAVAIPSLYTLAPPPSLPVGMAVHVVHGAVLGLVFAALASSLDLDGTLEVVGGGVAWGVVTWATLAALVMPLWLQTVGSPANPSFPNFALPSLLWHVVFGAVLGVVYVAVRTGR